MLSNPYRCVIDSDGNYITFVLLIEQPGVGVIPYAYILKEDEILIEAFAPNDMTKPRWNGSVWKETATPEEIETSRATTNLAFHNP